MRLKDTPNFNNDHNFNRQGIFLFVVFTSVVLGLSYFPETEITEALMDHAGRHEIRISLRGALPGDRQLCSASALREAQSDAGQLKTGCT
jgi:hypothetical protein